MLVRIQGLHIDQHNMHIRSAAFEADFLLFAQANIPGLQLGNYYKNIIAMYPNGMENLPSAARYTPRYIGL